VRFEKGRSGAAVFAIVLALAATLSVQTERAAQITTTSEAAVASGKLVYNRKCEACHFSTSDEKKIGPGLAGLMKRSKFRNGMTADEQHLRRVIERGGKDMPGFRDSLKDKQIRDLIAYVKTL
jgi:mono/diheme cytochrome c family protein